jgi:hypothetical protein
MQWKVEDLCEESDIFVAELKCLRARGNVFIARNLGWLEDLIIYDVT